MCGHPRRYPAPDIGIDAHLGGHARSRVGTMKFCGLGRRRPGLEPDRAQDRDSDKDADRRRTRFGARVFPDFLRHLLHIDWQHSVGVSVEGKGILRRWLLPGKLQAAAVRLFADAGLRLHGLASAPQSQRLVLAGCLYRGRFGAGPRFHPAGAALSALRAI